MAQRIIIPRMGQTMTEGTVAKWYVSDGDSVSAGDGIYELEYDKSSATIEAKASGIVRLLVSEGDVVPLGQAVAVILENGETLESVSIKGEHEVANAAEAEKEEPKKEENAAEAASAVPAVSGRVLASPLARKLARDKGIALSDITAANADGIIRATDVENVKASEAIEHNCEECSRCGSRVLITPLARKLAKEKGIDISLIKPADGMRIYKKDVLAYTPAVPAGLKGRRERMSGMRKVISERMSQSYFTYPTVTLNTTADMSGFLKMRAQINEKLAAKGVKLSVTDILVKIIAKALTENEIINTSIDGDEIVFHEEVNVGVAVALDAGLVVPVVRNADKLDFEEIAKEMKRLIGLAKAGSLGSDDMSGGTFSITNLGMSGIDTFNPIINYPQSAILGIGRTVETPVVRGGQIVIRPIMSLSLTHDHRVIDGVPAANFLKTVVDYLEKPFTLFI